MALPMADTRNALAELSERLKYYCKPLPRTAFDFDIETTQRIVAELAKVPDCTFKGNPRVDKSADAVIACRAIAEEKADSSK